MKLVTVAEMQAIEKQADQNGVSYAQLMHNAGTAVAEYILENFDASTPTVLALVGTGNNGGDALVAMTALLQKGWRAAAVFPIGRKQDALLSAYLNAGGTLIETDELLSDAVEALSGVTVLLDGVLGTGARLPLKPELKALFSRIKPLLADVPVVVIDCPSGMDCDTGAVDEDILSADITLCMEAVKRGMMVMPAFDHLGILEVLPIGLPDGLESLALVSNSVITAEDVAGWLPARPSDAHKGTFGTAVICAGSINYTGAALLAAEAAYRVGSGLVTIAAPASLHGALAGQLPEATWLILPEEQGVISRTAARTLSASLSRASAMLLGPGWGTAQTTTLFLQDLLTMPAPTTGPLGLIPKAIREQQKDSQSLPPLVIDASGLAHLAKIDHWQELVPEHTILTPHPGEMALLTGGTVDAIQSARIETACRFAESWRKIIVLKGALTVIASPDGRYSVNPVANAALARAGSGDVLAGLITGLLTQGVASYEAACAGVWLHAQCGLRALESIGAAASVLAGDLVQFLPEVLTELEDGFEFE